MSSHPMRKAQPKIRSSAPADALSALSEVGLLHMSCQLHSCCMSQAGNFIYLFILNSIPKSCSHLWSTTTWQAFSWRSISQVLTHANWWLGYVLCWSNTTKGQTISGQSLDAEVLERSNMLLLCALSGFWVGLFFFFFFAFVWLIIVVLVV